MSFNSGHPDFYDYAKITCIPNAKFGLPFSGTPYIRIKSVYFVVIFVVVPSNDIYCKIFVTDILKSIIRKECYFWTI